MQPETERLATEICPLQHVKDEAPVEVPEDKEAYKTARPDQDTQSQSATMKAELLLFKRG